MITNFHTHTCLCMHAKGEPIDYALQAQKDGCAALGFSDHCPYPESRGEGWDTCRMALNKAEGYIAAIQDVRHQVSFPVFAGFECEWATEYKSWYRDDLKGRFGADYLVLGSHWVSHEGDLLYVAEVSDRKILSDYIDQTITGMTTGLFAFLAHPDLFMMGWKEWNVESEAWSRALLEAAEGLDLPVEINGAGLKRPLIKTRQGERRGYPCREFWELAKGYKVRVICNSDAHSPDAVIANAQGARDYAAQMNIVPIDTLFPEEVHV